MPSVETLLIIIIMQQGVIGGVLGLIFLFWMTGSLLELRNSLKLRKMHTKQLQAMLEGKANISIVGADAAQNPPEDRGSGSYM